MSSGYLIFENGEVRLGGMVVPGILKSQKVQGSVRFDQGEQDSQSGTVKVPMGWDDNTINLSVELLTDTTGDCYDKLATLSNIFRGRDGGENPMVYDVVNPHLTARGIGQVVFSGLASSETDLDDVILATLSFIEHTPPVTVAEERSAGAAPKSSSAPPPLDSSIAVEVGQ